MYISNRQYIALHIVILIGLAIGGCTHYSPTQTITTNYESTVNIEPTISATLATPPTNTLPIQTPLRDDPTPTYIPLFSDFLTLPIAENPIFGSPQPNCRLPCWQGLTPSESTLGDVQTFFDDVLGYDGLFMVREYLQPGLQSDETFGESITQFENSWELPALPDEEVSAFHISFVFDDAFNLEGMEFFATPDGYSLYSLVQVVQELGTPQVIRTRVFEEAEANYFDVYMIYSQGIAIRYLYRQFDTSAGMPDFASFCFNTKPNLVNYYLTGSFDSLSSSTLTPLQTKWYLDTASSNGWASIEDNQRLTPDQFIEILLSEEPCITINMEEHRS